MRENRGFTRVFRERGSRGSPPFKKAASVTTGISASRCDDHMCRHRTAVPCVKLKIPGVISLTESLTVITKDEGPNATKEQTPVAHSRRRRRDSMSALGAPATALLKLKIRSEFVDGVEQELHGRAPMEATHAVTAAVGMMD